MGWFLGWIGLGLIVLWGHSRFWAFVKRTPHNNIKGVDTE